MAKYNSSIDPDSSGIFSTNVGEDSSGAVGDISRAKGLQYIGTANGADGIVALPQNTILADDGFVIAFMHAWITAPEERNGLVRLSINGSGVPKLWSDWADREGSSSFIYKARGVGQPLVGVWHRAEHGGRKTWMMADCTYYIPSRPGGGTLGGDAPQFDNAAGSVFFGMVANAIEGYQCYGMSLTLWGSIDAGP